MMFKYLRSKYFARLIYLVFKIAGPLNKKDSCNNLIFGQLVQPTTFGLEKIIIFLQEYCITAFSLPRGLKGFQIILKSDFCPNSILPCNLSTFYVHWKITNNTKVFRAPYVDDLKTSPWIDTFNNLTLDHLAKNQILL